MKLVSVGASVSLVLPRHGPKISCRIVPDCTSETLAPTLSGVGIIRE